MTGKYLLYARSGCEIYVRDELLLLNVDAYVGRVLRGTPDPKRSGRKRAVQWKEEVALPNYIWADMTSHQYNLVFGPDAKRIEGLAHTAMLIPHKAERDLRRFQDMTDKAYQEARRAMERGEAAPPAFDAGQALELIGGPLAGLIGSFRRIVEDADGVHVEIETNLTGKTRVSPAHVRKVG